MTISGPIAHMYQSVKKSDSGCERLNSGCAKSVASWWPVGVDVQIVGVAVRNRFTSASCSSLRTPKGDARKRETVSSSCGNG